VLTNVNAVLTVINEALRAQPSPPTHALPRKGGGNKERALPRKGGGNKESALPAKRRGWKLNSPTRREGMKRELLRKGGGNDERGLSLEAGAK
jgi:hypothetical protein